MQTEARSLELSHGCPEFDKLQGIATGHVDIASHMLNTAQKHAHLQLRVGLQVRLFHFLRALRVKDVNSVERLVLPFLFKRSSGKLGRTGLYNLHSIGA
eukprot:1147598-Pelagomonas_calceolata.AAC.6